MIKLFTVISARRRPGYPVWGWCAFLLFPLFMASCSSDDDGGSVADNLTTVQLYVSVPALPAGDGTRIGDPGTDTGEGEAWDALAILLEYTEEDGNTSRRRMMMTFTDEQFNSLPSYDSEGKIKRLSLDVPEGKVKIYGVTYTKDAANGIDGQLTGWKDGTVTDVDSMTISNVYSAADGINVNTEQFLSVATGFYKDKDNASGQPDVFEIKPVGDAGVGASIPTMTLTRLAAKIDIQWDAKGAYESGQGYVDVKVGSFKFSGDYKPGSGESGSGRLFPSLYTGNYALSGSKTFINQTEISQRNGRVYHYVYPDGASTPKVTFNITTDDGDGDPADDVNRNNYTFTFEGNDGQPLKLQQSTWYYIKTRINGLENDDTDITVTPEGTSGQAVTD